MTSKGPRIEVRSARSRLILTSALAAFLMSAVGFQSPANEPGTSGSGSSPHWGYNGFEGPLYWGTEFMPGGPDSSGKYQSFDLCLNGTTQSPISTTSLNKSETIAKLDIHPANYNGIAADNGHAIEVGSPVGPPISSLSYNGAYYRLIQIHFHAPSEHRRWDNAKGTYAKFDAVEMHLVHKSDYDVTAVVGVFITSSGDDSKPNSELAKVEQNLGNQTPFDFQVAYVLPPLSNWAAWTYQGSLTIPPCTERVRWFVMKEPLKVAPKQIEWLRSKYSNNSRGAAFEKVEGGLKQISCGEAGVWGVNRNNVLYVRTDVREDNIRGTAWKQWIDNIVDVASGKYGAWIVAHGEGSGYHVVHTTAAGAFDPVKPEQANLSQVSAGRCGVWALDTSRQLFYRKGVTEAKPMGIEWIKFSTEVKLKDITSGDFGVWGVDTNNVLYFLKGSQFGTLEAPEGSSFVEVDRNISRVSSGVLGVWALEAGASSGGQVTKSRTGLSAASPLGSGWRIEDGKFNEISNGKFGVWGTVNADPYPIYFLSSAPTQL